MIFVVISAVLIASLRSLTKKFLLKNSNEKTNISSLIGQKCRMLSETDFDTVGSVKIKDVVWSAVGEKQEVIRKGEIVEIVKVMGNKLVVRKAKEQTEIIEEKQRTETVINEPEQQEVKEEKVVEKPVKTAKNSTKTSKTTSKTQKNVTKAGAVNTKKTTKTTASKASGSAKKGGKK